MPLLIPAPAVLIRSFTLDDLDELAAVVQANHEHLSPWLPWVGSIHAAEDERMYVQMGMDKELHNNGFEAGIYWHGRLVGSIGMHYVAPETRATELGYWLSADSTGHGLMTMCVRAVLAYCFDTLQLNRVEIRAAAGNLRSKAVPERLGFRLEGVLRQAHALYGTLHDLAIYGLLAEEWAAAKASLGS